MPRSFKNFSSVPPLSLRVIRLMIIYLLSAELFVLAFLVCVLLSLASFISLESRDTRKRKRGQNQD